MCLLSVYAKPQINSDVSLCCNFTFVQVEFPLLSSERCDDALVGFRYKNTLGQSLKTSQV